MGGADNTQKILDVLADYGIKATFFVVGNWADQHPEQAKAIVDSGCELMNHSNAHDHYNSLTAEQIIKDVNTCNDKLEALTGARPTLIRCPFGEYDDYVIPNTIVEDGQCDTNYFQHQPYLDNFNEEKGTHLVTVAGIHVEPMGIYGGKQDSLAPIEG